MTVTPWEILWLLFVLITFIQLFYYLFFFSRLAFHKRKKEEDPSVRPPLSVVICARNEENNLRQNLPAILQQRYPHQDHKEGYEVIVVNDNSEDDTLHYLNSIVPGYPHFRQIELKQEARFIPGKKYPLSIGMKGAAHDIVVLTDADCKPSSSHWLDLMGGGFREGRDIVLGYGAYQKEPGFLNCMIRFETFFSALQYLSFAIAGRPYMGVGRNLAYRKELFFRHKGFLSHQQIPSGDDDLFINAAATGSNTSVEIDRRAFTYSVPKHTWKDWMRQKSRHLTTGKYYRASHRLLLGGWLASQLLYYPLLVFALLDHRLFWITLGLFGFRFLVQGVTDLLVMRRLDEADLFPLFWAWDIFICLYFLWAIPASFFAPKTRWN